jgi:hypothetical protein
MMALGHILFWLGAIIGLIGDIMFLAIVFRYSRVWFFGYLFIPFLNWVYFAFNARQTWKPTLIATVGTLISVVGWWLGGFSS